MYGCEGTVKTGLLLFRKCVKNPAYPVNSLDNREGGTIFASP